MATTAELEAKVRELEQRLRQMEKERLDTRGRALIDEVFPPESRRHMRTAWKEQLLALRSVLDHWIEKQESSNGASGTKRRESISVE